MKCLEASFYILFGFLAILFGAGIIIWVLYNEFIEKQAQYERPPLIGAFGVGPVLCGVGFLWIRKPFLKSKQEDQI